MKKIEISKKSVVRGEDGHKVISLRISTHMLIELERIAHQTERSRNELINILLSAALENVEIIDVSFT